ncbi:type IV secretory system conjugative DNA transfer family protein [Aliarcobacter butzleri]|uniref:type IV secretory system conjugative DNA transfer family protein n=1 Tax=Aliarcobacter butzleri TaxID=28197 RepID=UPI0021B4C354|nr:TraM recognition domain-containing protein [Aliarcobacter butzleri]MCT7563189.1 TraM recognition domain-containing protein [Aliarcobacter butzleri]MCT7578664.1 TraM recognition domain-containing protein [Aliarcobacter butzleri]MCT7647606.1 TraM recognition domain-containing protein [Aliarcobacter butzleri]
MKKNSYILNDIIYNPDGKMNTRPSDNLDLGRGLFNGVGISLTKTDAKPERIYIKWSTLNSHKLTIGTTRQGKSRKMISDIEQQIANNANVFIGEPKGSEDQEIIGYTLQLAIKYKREKEIIYISAYHKKYSACFNPLYRKKNAEISSLIGEMIEAKEPVYKNVGRARVLAILLSLDFIEKFDALENPFDLIIMERYELAKLETEKVNWLNKHIFGAKYSESEHGYKWDILKSLLSRVKNDLERKQIEEAYRRTLERNKKSAMINRGDVLPLRKYITFEDLSKFDTVDSLAVLQEEVRKRFESLPDNADEDLKDIGSQAMRELEKRMRDDPTFIGKLLNSYAMVLTDVTTEDVGYLLNSCRVNPVLDALTSNDRGAIIIYQPFPLIYSAVSNVLGRIMFSMFSSMSGYIGASGVMLKRRLFVNIDEAGAILSPIVRELSNKGGGLGFSLCLYTQSIADIIDTLEETGARIILDNMNTKEFFKVNDNTTAQEIATIMGTIRKAETTTTASDQRNTRNASQIKETDIANASIIQRLSERTFLLKEGSEVYLVAAPNVSDTIIKIKTPIPSLGDLSEDTYTKRKQIKESMK